MTASAWQGQWAPRSDDPDPPQKPLSKAELTRFGEGMKRLLEGLRQRSPVPAASPAPPWVPPPEEAELAQREDFARAPGAAPLPAPRAAMANRLAGVEADFPLILAELRLLTLRLAETPDEGAIHQICDFIARTPAATRTGTMVKLRVLADPQKRSPPLPEQIPEPRR